MLLPRVVALSHLCLDAMRDTGVVARPAHWARLLRASAELVMASLPDGFAPDARAVELCVEGLGSLLARFDADVEAGLAEPPRAADLAPPVLALSLRGDARAQAAFVLAVKLEAMAGAPSARSRHVRDQRRSQPVVRAWLPERLWGCLIKGMAARGDVAGVRSALQRMRSGHSTSLWALAGRQEPSPAPEAGAGDFSGEWSGDDDSHDDDDDYDNGGRRRRGHHGRCGEQGAGPTGARTPRAGAGSDAPVTAASPSDFGVHVMPVEPSGQTLRLLVRAHALARDWGGARAAIDEALDALAAAPPPRSSARPRDADAAAAPRGGAGGARAGDDAAGLWGELMDAAVRGGETALARSVFEEASGADSGALQELPGWLWQLRVRASSCPADAEATLARMMRAAAGADPPRAWPGIWATLFDLHESQRCPEGMASVIGRMRGGVVCWAASRAESAQPSSTSAGELVWATHNDITAPVGQVEVLTNSVAPSVAFARRASNGGRRGGKRTSKPSAARRRA
ncbi:hypothetical protein FNF29_03458 [Cafeteria roenbergensis]|uniref:Uncharacterized protein n=1 Tax=Cafeteria roenbergensis TaxID=33653 RepID=A0A5A8CK84_CAFRO|nr:hypothetical protein FNF29_03458 [Cafeteria roenbergensis]|eukprot:KAA0152934.1 hypothetical protein FNF29_03458 [Cafeteria roenbergensis]